MEACRKTYVFNWTVLMYLLEEVHKWDHSTCKAQPQLELQFSKFYKRVKLIALYSQKQRTKQKTIRATIQHLTFKGYIKACFNIYFFNSWRRLFLFNLIVKTIQKYFARPYNP